MVNVYLRDEIEFALLTVANTENEIRIEKKKKPNITKGTIAARIIDGWYQKYIGEETDGQDM
jgi:hypothetical protein